MSFKRKASFLVYIVLTTILTINTASAGNIGSDLNTTLTPAAGGMAGVGIARPQDIVASIFANPATLTQLEGETEFTFGAALLDVTAKADHDGTITGVPFKADSTAENYLLPEIGVAQKINDEVVIGGGLQVITGLGSDFRTATALRPLVELIVFGANAGIGYQVNDNLSIGGSATIAFGLLELGLMSNTGLVDSFGLRVSGGLTYDYGNVIFGANYDSSLQLEFDDVTETSPGVLTDFDLEQPQQVSLGFASTSKAWKDFILEVDIAWKNWGSADGYEDIWDDQVITSIGGQYTNGSWKYRGGYSFATDLQKKNVGNSVGNISSLNVFGQTFPVSPPLVEFIQATLTQPYWQQQIYAGIGYQLSKQVSLDVNIAYAFDGDRTIGATKVEVNEIQLGFGFTWKI